MKKSRTFLGLGILALTIAGMLSVKANHKTNFSGTIYYSLYGSGFVPLVVGCSNLPVLTISNTGNPATINGQQLYYFSSSMYLQLYSTF